jgi:transposase
MTAFFANLPPCVIGVEACGSAHHRARTLKSLGHDTRLMSPQFVKPYVKSNKNDVADAEAICEAVARPNMRFIPVKERRAAGRSIAASGPPGIRQGAHCASQPDPQSPGRVRPDHAGGDLSHRQACAELARGASKLLPGSFRQLITRLTEHLKDLDMLVDEFEAQIKAWASQQRAQPEAPEDPGDRARRLTKSSCARPAQSVRLETSGGRCLSVRARAG